LVHGSVVNGAMTWPEQRPLEQRWSLLVLDRRGYPPNPPIDREDFEVDARDVAELAVEHGPLHLMGHSYGGVIALLAAAQVPQSIRSLVVIEPPAFGSASEDPVIQSLASRLSVYVETGPRDPDAFVRGFIEHVSSSARLPSPLPPDLQQSAALLQVERFPGEAVIPLDELRRAPFPKLVVSGGHHDAFERLCNVIAEGIGARRVVIEGAGHSVQRTGARFNEEVERLWREAEADAS
jgi:pimeloyl-ACP methyl ester carboxylesterase